MEKEREKEMCVMCKKVVPGVYKDTPVDQRDYYIEGGGQLCRKCHLSIYKK